MLEITIPRFQHTPERIIKNQGILWSINSDYIDIIFNIIDSIILISFINVALQSLDSGSNILELEMFIVCLFWLHEFILLFM